MEPNELPDNLQGIRHLHTYKVPPGYFEGLADDVISKIHVPLSADMPFSQPPVHYFDTLADSVLSKIKRTASQSEVQKELEELEPMLASLPKTNVYRVSDGYFDSFTVAVPADKKSATVIPMRRKTSWIKYASAAVIAGMIATGAIFFIKGKEAAVDTQKYSQALAKVSDNELVNYLDNTSVDDMAAPVDNSDMGSSEGLFQFLLDNVSDKEIQEYLNENDDSDEKNIKGI